MWVGESHQLTHKSRPKAKNCESYSAKSRTCGNPLKQLCLISNATLFSAGMNSKKLANELRNQACKSVYPMFDTSSFAGFLYLSSPGLKR
jgi:hypothetical protein